MASQHRDDIGVACIDDTCQVLGLAPFCRYNCDICMHKILFNKTII